LEAVQVALISVKHLSFSYESASRDVFSDLSLVIETHWRTGLVGRNGQGKSTLLKLLAGALRPSTGAVELSDPVVSFPAPVMPGLTTRDTIVDAVGPFRAWSVEMERLLTNASDDSIARYAQLQEAFQLRGGYEIEGTIEREFVTMGLTVRLLDRPFTSLSGGERTRALMTALFATKNRFPLIDEPTNHLDSAGRKQLSLYLATKTGFLLVSHDRQFLDGAVDHIVSLNKHDVRVTRGNYNSWQRHMEEIELHEQRTRTNIEREVKHLKVAAVKRRVGADKREDDKHKKDREAKPNTGFIGRRAAKQMKRALVLESRIGAQLEQKQNLLLNQEKRRSLKIDTAGGGGGALVWTNNLAAGYEGESVFSGVSFTIKPGDRVAVVGANGSGKSTLLNVICGELKPLAGQLDIPSRLRISRSYQHPLWQTGELRARLAAASLGETRFRQLMGVLGIDGEVFERELQSFSPGQLKKVDLCRSIMAEADLLVWDEPLNYVDLFSREQIEAAILESQPTLIFVEHDQRFVDRVATQLVQLTPV
jgi:lincosamide and streptogramin A transport system ATP-binding/permease protein